MNKVWHAMGWAARLTGVLIVGLTVLIGSGFCGEAVNIILKNDSSAAIEVELVDQYGGNYKAGLDAGMSQNHTVMINSEVKVDGNSVHVVAAEDEGKEVLIGAP